MNVTRIRSRRNHEGARLALSTLLTVSMLLGSVPNGALQAMAEELEVTPVEEVVPEAEDQATPSVEGEAQGETPADVTEGEAAEPAEGEETDADALVPLAAAAPEEEDGGPLRAVSIPGTRDTVDTNALGVTINMFDYEITDKVANSYSRDTRDTGGINTDKDKDTQLNFYGTGDGDANTQYGVNPGNGINEFTGIWKPNMYASSTYDLQMANQGIVQSRLSSDGYPLLNTKNCPDPTTNYLFDTSSAYDDPSKRTTYAGVNNLFYLRNQGALNEMLVYDSNESYAIYNKTGDNAGNFTVYSGTYPRKRHESDTSGMMVGFFPFDPWWTGADYPEINPNYCNGGTPDVHHHFGLTLDFPITMPLDGKIHTDKGDAPMVFEFAGDDDMWVFVDGKLVLDIGGIHQPVRGTIDFATGVVELSSGTAEPKNDQQGQYAYDADGINPRSAADELVRGEKVYLWNGFYDGVYHNGILGDRNSSANRAGTEHRIQAFYLERGGCDSNLIISTNIHLMTKKRVTVSKEWAADTLDTEKNLVQVQLIRKGVGRNAPNYVEYAVIDTAELNQDGSWSKTWEDLPTEGYNASGVFDETPGATNTYCDYSYMVREVPVYGFEDTYATEAGSTITAEEITYTDGGETVKVEAAPVNDSYDPVKITNTPIRTSVAVEKAWSDGAENHAGESVYVQLQKTVGGATSDVGDPVKLDASNSWKHTFTELQLLPEGDTYNVIEGIMESGSFVAYTDAPFIIGSSVYRRVSVSYYDEEDAVMTGATSLDGAVEPYAGKVVITNEPVKAKVTILKIDATSRDALEGAKFVVYENAGAEAYDVADDTNPSNRVPDADTEFVSGDNGKVEITDLIPGAYWIVETVAPAGHLVMGPDNPIGVKVDNEGNVSLVDKNGSPITNPAETEPSISTEQDGTIILTVPNARTYTLPAAGGPGAYPFLFAGAFVAAFTLAGEDNRRRMMGLLSAGARR